MARIVTTFAAILTALAHLQLSNFNVYADNKFMQAYSKLVSDLEIMVDWNETLELLPGFECYEERPLDLPPLGKELSFPCDDLPPSDEIPTSVHRIRPGDIKAIGAMGDSLTAANGAGACFLPELLYMYRGLTFSHGGDESFETNPTLANILRKYNPDLKGYGVNTGMWDTKDASLNVGHPGDIAASTATSDLKDRLVRIESTSESKSQSGHSLGRAAQLILAASGKRSAPSSPSQTAPINKENPSASSPLI
eukprot:XP_011661962.1 PREDICTED: phospholipase B1, membrane-associated-like [Strongylocentrotus purpuratus]